ncbi:MULTISPECIES: GDP-mannose mannosyl hydrolase [Enterobacteriaceae]|uniref:GDP-mannose mannosyl hydrolase n=1 Tax=Enterobacteriaceae TaxID=543 RepID=UPI0003EDC40C|nr:MULTISPECIES: GDP-mannose mannosyl hydrolase [Enterobacteriaceae]EIH0604270.1 GDP-mannose mannosyl hydrolase [Escherichia coli O55]ANE62943.1 GDP-mannose mannosyl hydrolase [Escherichia coli]EFO4565674.1 GDP-mannose mannosyl hydrolase [Escherichia coli]EHJ4949289.1 GDP-mannose mannosyl hydrolase [Escherichia coli]EHK0386769.1 GDP-mannose mannosyl hydrolase [Escherichia coli]
MLLDYEDLVTVVRYAPLISIDLIIENEYGEFLLGKRCNRPAQGYWFVPGGRIYKNETFKQAFCRITEKEIGVKIDIKLGAFYGVWQHFYKDNFSTENFSTHYVVIAFKIKLLLSNIQLPKLQHDEWKWFSPELALTCNEVHENTRAYFRTDNNFVGLNDKGACDV